MHYRIHSLFKMVKILSCANQIFGSFLVGNLDWIASICFNCAVQVGPVFFFTKSQKKQTKQKIQLRTIELEDVHKLAEGSQEPSVHLHDEP